MNVKEPSGTSPPGTTPPTSNNNNTLGDMGLPGSDMGMDPSNTSPGEDMGEPIPEGDCGVTLMYRGLEPTCGTCHRVGNSPYFTSPEAFYNLLVTDPNWVVPGQPENSQLVALLEGGATGAYVQMPLGTRSFAQLAEDGETEVSMEEVRAFITDLDGCQRGGDDIVEHAPIERKSARQIVNTMYQHLGLEPEDVQRFTSNLNIARYPVQSPDDVKPIVSGPNVRHSSSTATLRWYALGGGSQLLGTRPVKGFSPTFGQAITQMSQAWCRFAVEKDGNTALFRHVQQASMDAASDEQIRENLRYLMLRFWGHVATDEEVTELETSIYRPYATQENARTAWVAVCASLIRDPMWMSY